MKNDGLACRNSYEGFRVFFVFFAADSRRLSPRSRAIIQPESKPRPEAKEETGLSSVAPLETGLFSIETLTVNPHHKRGQYVPAHLHLNVTFLLEADASEPLRSKPDENSAVEWLPLEQAADNREEPFMAIIYQKLNEKLKG